MPVLVKMGKPDHELERVMMSKKRGAAYFQMLNNFMEKQNDREHPEPQICTVEMMKKLLTLLQEELAVKRFDDAKVVVSTIQFLAHFPEFPEGISVLLSNGLMNLLVYVMDEAQKFVSKSDGSVTNTSADALMEVIMETINDVADCAENTKREAVNAFTTKLMKLIVCSEKKFRVRMEALRTLNLLLDGCDSEAVQELHNFLPNVKLMGSMAEFLTTAGDFEMQVACTESLVRIVKRADRSTLAHQWFTDNDFAGAFMQIKDETFEADCRKFLNYVNESIGKKRSVFSLPCISAYLGSFKLKCPLDVNLKDFWVDFNTVSNTITLYIAEDVNSENNQEAGMWETVTIRKESVEKFYHTEKGDRQALFITLNVPPSNLVAFCTSGDRQVRILFDSQLDIATPVLAVFGKERSRNSKYKASVSQINIQVHRDEFDSPGPQRNIRSADEGSDTVSIQSARIYGLEEGAGPRPSGPVMPPPVRVPLEPSSGISHHPSGPHGHSARSSVPVKRVGTAEDSITHKVSIPLSPMRTPSRMMSETSSVSSTTHVPSNRSLAKKSDFIQPKTPVKPTPPTVKRVKTPLQIVVGDKTNTDSGNESNATFSSSIHKKASSSSGVSIGSTCTPDLLRQKLLQVGRRRKETSGRENCQEGRGLGGGGKRQDGSKSDPGTSASKKSKQDSTQDKRQLRSRGDDVTQTLRASSMSNLAGPQSDEISAKQDVDGANGPKEVTDAKKLSRKKFRLYTEGGMMMGSDEGDQDNTDAEMVIPSSIPTQESIEVIPESLPPSGQPLQTDQDQSTSRTLDKSSCVPPFSVTKSPSLSTLTEESAQTSHSRSNKGTTPNMNEHDEESQVRQMLRPRDAQKSPLPVGNKNPSRQNAKERGNRVNQKAKYGSSTSGPNDTSDGIDEESDADDEEDEQMRTSSRKDVSIKPSKKNEIIKDQPTSLSDKIKATTNQTQDASPKKFTSMPPSRAFRKKSKTPESSQELSQLEFTSQMEIRPKRGRPKKNAPKEVVKGKKQVAQRGKPGKTVTSNPEPKTRNRRAAANKAKEKILTQSQLGAATNSDSHLSKSECSTDDAIRKPKGTTKAVSSTAGELTHPYSEKIPVRVPYRPTASQNISPNTHDLSVYDFVDLEEGARSKSAIRSPFYSAKKTSTTKDKSPPFLSASQNVQDISVYDFNDSESTSTQGRSKQIRGRKKQTKPAVKGVKPRKKAPINKPRKKQQKSPEQLSDIERSRDISRQKPPQKTKYALSPIEVIDDIVGSPITYEDLSDIGQPETVSRWQPKQSSKKCAEKVDKQPINVPVKKNTERSPSSCEDLSDIEQPKTTSRWQPKKSSKSKKCAEKIDEQPINVPAKKNTKTPSSSCDEDLSDIEQPRNAAPMPRGSLPQLPLLPRNLDSDDEYCDEEVSDFIGTLTTQQRQFFERGLKIVKDVETTRKPKPAKGKKLPPKVPRSLGMSPTKKIIVKSASKPKVITISEEDEEEDLDMTPAPTSVSKRHQEKPSRSTSPVLSSSRNQQEKSCPSMTPAVQSASNHHQEKLSRSASPVLSVLRNKQEKPCPSSTSSVTSVARVQKERVSPMMTPTMLSTTRKRQQLASVTQSIKLSSSGNQQERPLTSTVSKKLREDNKSASLINSRSFGSQIVEEESEEIATRESARRRCDDDGSEGLDEDVISVENFSKMCQKMVKKSGKGIAAARPRRNIPTINYQSQDSGSESGEELPKDRSQPSSEEDAVLYSRKRRQDADDSLTRSKKRISLETDAVSERSWLTEKPKQKVSTYSKNPNQQWVTSTSMLQLDTVKKPKRQAEKRTKLPPNQPKKRKKKQIVSPDSDNNEDDVGVSVHYYREESAGIGDSQPCQKAVNKTTVIDKPSRKENITQPISEPEDLCPLMPSVDDWMASQYIADLVTPRLSLHSTNSSRCNSIGKSPKVTFDCDPESDEDVNLPNQEQDILKSGPSTWPRPSSSSLKRKYGNLFTSDNEEEGEEEDNYEEEVGRSEDANRLTGSLRPKKLFKGVLPGANIEADEDEDEDVYEDEDDILNSDGQTSSTASMEILPTVHITQMLKAVGENLKQKMMTKRIQAQKLTDGAVKSTQKSVLNMWAKQLQARSKCQEEFKSVLLSELLSLETDLGNLQEQYMKMEAYLKQHHRKVASTLIQHVSRVKSLQSEHREESRDLNHELGKHLLQSVKQVLAQEMVTMQKKLLQDSQQHEIQQMKRSLQTMLMQ
ncbi:serine/arginine repetitive matrix protein 2-like isoform X2 [Asterias rubens]|uniref:serine/arginine repetitive matrix protein 2-like isoform X2 n=1 Tax=Asterias rubens TaxID=7604 RepID=UPI0014558C2B|nr:serine/arginine repetitive matrix protein 2-like isoform X2 [Asterias rubens]